MALEQFRRRFLAIGFAMAAAVFGGAAGGLLGVCGPFTDVAADAFCPFVLEVFYLGITTGTTPTTYDPASNVSRLQMAAFLSRTVDGVLRRGSRRAPLQQFWTTGSDANVKLVPVPKIPRAIASDGWDLWVTSNPGGRVTRVRGSDGKVLGTWFVGARSPVLAARGRVFVTTDQTLAMLDPTPTSYTDVANLGDDLLDSLAYDGGRIWVPGRFSIGVAIVTPGPTIPWTVTTVTTGFSFPHDVLYDGANIWCVDASGLLKLDANAAILQTVTMAEAHQPVFDGTNIWVTNGGSNTVTVVRASTGAVLTTLTGNGLNAPQYAAFDGQRVLVTGFQMGVSLWKAADLSPIGNFSVDGVSPGKPFCVAGDGVGFWLGLTTPPANPSDYLVRF
jgi:YVTN family beta-propeller protein